MGMPFVWPKVLCNVDAECRCGEMSAFFFMLRRNALSSYLFVKLWLHLQLIYLYMYNNTLGNEQKSPLFSFLLAGKERPRNGM